MTINDIMDMGVLEKDMPRAIFDVTEMGRNGHSNDEIRCFIEANYDLMPWRTLENWYEHGENGCRLNRFDPDETEEKKENNYTRKTHEELFKESSEGRNGEETDRTVSSD